MTLVITLEQRGRSLELQPGQFDGEVDESSVLLTFQASTRPTVELDDNVLTASWRSRECVAACTFDLTNQVGYHRLRVRIGAASFEFDFHTSTTKATRDEVLAMATVCGQHYLGYRRQFAYVAANGERRKVLLPQIHYAWLRDRLSEIEKLARSINQRPAINSIQRLRPSTGARGISVPGTIRLIHEQPHLLEESESGPLVIAGKSYWPALVMQRIRDNKPAVREHVTIARFLQQLLRGCRDLRSEVDSDLRSSIDRFTESLVKLLALPVLSGVGHNAIAALPAAATPTAIERADERYARLRTLRSEYLSDIGPSDDYRRSLRANIKDVAEIYQTFVTHVIGNAMGLTYCSSSFSLRDRDSTGASMRSTDWALGFDAKPPGTLLTSWRDRTIRAANERPDISLVGVSTEKSILLDAKFRVAKTPARATQEDLFEMQGYLNSFAIPRGGIVYPGSTPSATLIESDQNRLLELPIRASFFDELGGSVGMHDFVRKAIDLALQPITH